MSKNLSIAYNVKKKSSKKMAHGGEVSSEKPKSESSGSHMFVPNKVAHAIMKKHMMSEGGMVEAPSDDVASLDTSYADNFGGDDDFLSAEEQTPLSDIPMFDEEKPEEDPKKRILSQVMNGIRSKHMGK